MMNSLRSLMAPTLLARHIALADGRLIQTAA
jgi:hypothetical protein